MMGFSPIQTLPESREPAQAGAPRSSLAISNLKTRGCYPLGLESGS